jgi:hypothetical protein
MERRRHFRYPLTIAAVAIPLGPEQAAQPLQALQALGVRIGDVSQGGAGGVSAVALPARMPVVVVLPEGGERSVRRHRGHVAHCRANHDGYALGFCFCPAAGESTEQH